MNDNISEDIWFHIAQFLPDDFLRNLIGINRTFFDIAMNARYREILLKFPSPMAEQLIGKLSDPVVSRRTRRLHLRLNHVERHTKYSEVSKWRFRALLRLGRPSHSSFPPNPLINKPPSRTLVEGLTAVFPGMINLEELSIDSWPVDFDLRPLLPVAWVSFGKNLRKLSLGGHLEGFRTLIASRPLFESLQDLSLEFTDKYNASGGSNTIGDAAILLDYVVPFLNILGPNYGLGRFPALGVICIRASFNRSFADPSGLTQLLHASPNLRELELRLNPSGYMNELSEQRLLEWLSVTIMNNEGMSTNLQSLQLYPTTYSAGFNVMLVCIQRSATTLESLVVRDRYLQYEEIVKIIMIFPAGSRLRYLRLNVWSLSTDLLDLLYKNLPGLEELVLNITDDRTAGPTQLDLKTGRYSGWKLYDIGFPQGGSPLDHETMLLIARCIPSVRSFWGEGHMESGDFA